MNLQPAIMIVALSISILGFSGSAMGVGYLITTSKRSHGGPRSRLSGMTLREKVTGWSSVVAGIAVAVLGTAVWTILSQLFVRLDNILALLAGR